MPLSLYKSAKRADVMRLDSRQQLETKEPWLYIILNSCPYFYFLNKLYQNSLFFLMQIVTFLVIIGLVGTSWQSPADAEPLAVSAITLH